MNNFLFIIPLTPNSHLTPLRAELQKICFDVLLKQSYSNWKAIIIGENRPNECNDARFIHIQIEGPKELKLQYATKYISDNKVDVDYIIRLDDDDIINPTIIEKYKNTQADAIVDLYHYFIEWETKKVSKEFRPWFPNTIIHKTEHALAEYGQLSKVIVDKINSYVSLLETDHSKMHKYYFGKNVQFNTIENPIYFRVLNKDSITSNAGKTYNQYLQEFGQWNNGIPNDFNFIKPTIKNITIAKKSLYDKLKHKLFIKRLKSKFISQFKSNIK